MQRDYSNQPNDRNGDNGSPPLPTNSNLSGIDVPPHNLVENTNRPTIMNNIQSVSQYTMRNNLRDVLNRLTPLMHNIRPTEGNNKGIRSLMRRTNTMGESSNSNSPDNFVINFENINEASSSSTSQQYNGSNSNRIVPEQYLTDHTSLEIENTGHHSTPQQYAEYSNSGSVTDGASNISNNSNNGNNNNNVVSNSLGQTAEGTSEVQNTSLNNELVSLYKFFHEYYSFITFLLVKPLYDHREGIFIFAGLIVTFVHANSVLKREVAKQSRRSLLSLSILAVNLSVCICFIYYVFRDQKLYKSLILIPPYHQPLSIWDLLWMVGITDFVLKFITILLKAGVACFPAQLISYSSRGKWYLMLESKSQLYRGIAPIQPWLYYLMESYQGSEKVIGVIFCVAYVISKGTELLAKVKAFLAAFWKLIQNVSLGVRPSKEELEAAGPLCPICHDEYTTPELLHCKHVFCEACIATWFDREQTCPLCRAKITDVPLWRDGSTTYFTQLF